MEHADEPVPDDHCAPGVEGTRRGRTESESTVKKVKTSISIRHWETELREVAEQFDEDGSQTLSSAELKAALRQYMELKKSAAQGMIDYTNLPPEVANALKEFDHAQDGKVTSVELVRAAAESRQIRSQNAFFRKALITLLFAVVILLIGVFALTFVAIDLSKETRSLENGVLTAASNGQRTLVDSASFEVLPDGRMVVRDLDQDGRRLQNGSAEAASSGEDVLITGAAPAKARALTSVVPDQYLSEMKKVRLELGADGATLELDVLHYVRKLDAGSQCGSVVHLQTEWGVLILDDTDIYLDLSLKRKAEEELDMSLEGLEGDFSASSFRRLSAGSSIVGLFNFIMDYEWSCESTAKPLEQLQPPYSFTIRTLVWCGSYCNSEFISGSSLPGFATDLATSEYEYVAQTERVIASETEMVSIQQWPNLPGVEISKHVNIQTGLAQVVKTFTSKMLSCSSEVDNSILAFKNSADWAIAAMGRVESGGEWFRRFHIFLKDEGISETARKMATVELWERSTTMEPYKFFLPNQLQGTSISFFTNFSKEVSLEELQTIKEDIQDDCSKTVEGPDSRFAKLANVSVLDEKQSILNLYQDLFDEGLIPVPDVPYWQAVAAQDSSDEAPPVLELQESESNGSNASGSRRLSARGAELAPRVRRLRASSDRRRRASQQERNELDGVSPTLCPMAFTLGDRFSFQFCNQNEVASDGSRTEDFAFTLDAEHAPKVQFGPVQVGLSGMGELKVRCKVGQDHCYGAGAIEFAVELGVGLGELITAAVGGRGGLEVEVPTQTAGAPQDTFKVVGSLTPYGTVDLFAGLISFEVPYKYPGIEVTFDRLGPFPLQNPNNKADDTISIAAKWTVEVSFLGIFTFTVSVPITVMPETTLWKATPDMYGKQPWFTSDCELVERTYDRCSQNHIKLTGTWDEKTGEWERHIQKGHEAYSMISSDPKKDFRWCCGHSWCDEWVRFDRHVNKIVVQLENSDRRIVWVGLVCDRYLHDNNRFHYSGRTDDDCREDVRVETARGWVHVPKHHRKGVMMHRWSDNRWTWYCNHNSRRRGYRQGHHGSGCGRHNYLVVDWQDRRRNTAVRWECWQRLGKERPTSGTCTSVENFYVRPWSSWSFGVDSPQACSRMCAEDMSCWHWTWEATLQVCIFSPKDVTLHNDIPQTFSGLPSYNCEATFFSFEIPLHSRESQTFQLPHTLSGQDVVVTTVDLTTCNTIITEPCNNDDARWMVRQSECIGRGSQITVSRSPFSPTHFKCSGMVAVKTSLALLQIDLPEISLDFSLR